MVYNVQISSTLDISFKELPIFACVPGEKESNPTGSWNQDFPCQLVKVLTTEISLFFTDSPFSQLTYIHLFTDLITVVLRVDMTDSHTPKIYTSVLVITFLTQLTPFSTSISEKCSSDTSNSLLFLSRSLTKRQTSVSAV